MTERLFVSSVQKEFAEERRMIRDFIQRDPLMRRFFTVFLFEDLPASDRRADGVYLAEVDKCDVFINLLGAEYGSEDATGRSPTEREFDRATEMGKTRLVYIRDGKDYTPHRHQKVHALIDKAGSELIRRRFTTVAELRDALYASMVEHLERSGAIQTAPFDAAPCLLASLDDLDTAQLDGFLARAQARRSFAVGPGTPLKVALSHLNLLHEGHPTHASVLLFAKVPQRFLPTSEVKCAHFHGTEISKPIPSYQIYIGTVFELVDQAVDFVLSKIAASVGTRAGGTTSPLQYELPREAVAEAIVNAVVHRDYASHASVQVMLFSDRLEIWNPGELPPTLTLSSLREPHPSVPRNPLLAGPMFLAGYIEKAGTGTLDMADRCREAGLPSPEFRQETGIFKQIFRRRPALQVTPQVTRKYPASTPQVRAVLKAITEGEESREVLQTAAGIKDREHFRREYLEPLLSAGLLERTIPDKPRSSHQKYRLTTAGRAFLAETLREEA